MEKKTDRARQVVEKMKRFGQAKDLAISFVWPSEIRREQHSDPVSEVKKPEVVS